MINYNSAIRTTSHYSNCTQLSISREVIAAVSLLAFTRDKMRAAKRKGKYCGDMIPLGYDIEPTMKRMVINEAEAEVENAIICMYLGTGRTVDIRKAAQIMGWTAKTWERTTSSSVRRLRFKFILLCVAGAVGHRRGGG